MRSLLRALVLLAASSSGAGCVTSHFEEIATQAAASDARCDSSRAVEVERLTSYGYRAQVCGGTVYYRCWTRRKTMGRVQCCQRVETEDEATSVFWSSTKIDVPPAVCREAE